MASLAGAGRHPKRLLWLLNHKTLLPGEVTILESLGFEVFVSSKVPPGSEHVSSRPFRNFGSSLPQQARELLEEHNFFTDPWSEELQSAINDNFDAIITVVAKAALGGALTHYKGPVFGRVFGREGTYTYDNLFTHFGITDLIRKSGNRFVLLAAYPNIALIEPDYLKSRCVTVGSTLPAWMWQYANTWTGSRDELLFLCPRISSDNYFRDSYVQIKKEFGDLPHKIMGVQVRPVKDPHVLGYVDDNTLFDYYAKSAAFLYTSPEPRHIHYTPVEAIMVGAPVLYLHGGMLTQIAGKPLPGECETLAVMKEKAKRLLVGDRDLAQEIIETQKQLLRPFETEVVRDEWRAILST